MPNCAGDREDFTGAVLGRLITDVRDRRLRAYLKYARMSVAVALAECQHHTAQRQKTARAGREEQVALHGHGPEQLPSQPELFQLFEEEPCGSRPPCLSEPRGPQEKVQQRSVDQIADYALMVQILDTSKPHMVDQLVAVLTQVDSFVPEQVIAVPKISSPPRCSRTVLGEPQTNSWWKRPLLCLSLQYSSTSLTLQLVQGGLGSGGLQGFLPGQSFPTVEQTVDIPAPRGDPLHFHPFPGSAALSSEFAGKAYQVFFALFPEFKNVRSPPRVRVPGLHGHSSSRTRRLVSSLRLVVSRRRGSSSACGCGWTPASGSCLARMSSVLGQGEMQFLGTDMG